MTITKYRTELNQQKQNILIKESEVNYNINNLNDPQLIVKLLNNCYNLNRMAEEYMYMVALTTKNSPLGIFEISHGTVNYSIISPREIFIRLLLTGASGFILSHNHPSGDCTPSKEDTIMTRRIKEAADIVGINFIDHIIIGDSTYKSFNEYGLL